MKLSLWCVEYDWETWYYPESRTFESGQETCYVLTHGCVPLTREVERMLFKEFDEKSQVCVRQIEMLHGRVLPYGLSVTPTANATLAVSMEPWWARKTQEQEEENT